MKRRRYRRRYRYVWQGLKSRIADPPVPSAGGRARGPGMDLPITQSPDCARHQIE